MKSFNRSNVIVIGAGHNGLVAAAYLARAGLSVTVLERGDSVGGAARTVEFAPGVRVSGVAHIVNLLHPKIFTDLDLEAHGLTFSAMDINTVALDRDARNLVIGPNGDIDGDDVSDRDSANWGALHARLQRFAGALRPMLLQTPPRLGSSDLADNMGLAGLGLRLRRLGRRDMRAFLRTVLMNAADMLDDELEDTRLKGAIALDAVMGAHLGPRSPGSVLNLLYRMSGEILGEGGAMALPRGGMGAVCDAMREASEAAGAQIVLGAGVERLIVRNDRVVGVVLETGDELGADVVLSAINPRTTLLDLLGPEHLDAECVHRLVNIRMRGNAAKLHLALDGIPEFVGVDRVNLDGRLLLAPSIDYVERAFNPSKYGQASEQPAMEITIPSIADPTLAPPGKHVLSAVVQYVPYELRQGWDGAKDAYKAVVIDNIAAYAPDIRQQIAASELLCPQDFAERYAMPGGHWHHGELAPDQLLNMRPVPGAAQYAAPIAGLYLSGAGTHPGGGVSGAAGHNAARRIIEREGRG